ncbi:hypothetical protein GG804_12395 [Sphingomonas histidinilytica]|nr:hypothetical protein [Rhizorhabdus histidinilytica]
MVQTKARRRSSLIMGVLLALLLGVAAAFFVLAMPIRMLETVTTFTRLSKLMVQAEPPISPNDRTLLSVLAAILTAGIGWVLVDWLVFGRAGMSTLIRTRDDDYEDEDEDHFRPTDPLDLVTPAEDPAAEWPVPSTGDARRPLSARTDIGDPPPALDPFGAPLAGLNQALPPISEILPGTGVSAPPLQPNALPPLIQPAAFPQAAPFPEAEPAPPEMPPPAGGLPTWMPAPGLRPDGQAADPLPAAFYEEPAEPGPEPEVDSAPAPDAAVPPSLIGTPAVPQPVPPLPTPQAGPFAPPPLADEMPPLAAQPFADPQPAVAVRQPDQPPAAAPAPAPAQPAPRPRPLPEPGFDRARLEELLARLERGLQQRRAAAAARAQAEQSPPAPQQAPAPVPTAMPMPAAAPPSLTEPPAPPPIIEPVPPMSRYEPPAAPAPASILPVAPPRAVPELRSDELLDQPLHVTLDLLRNMVKR